MNSNKLWMTATIPSGFGMPMSGHAFCATPVVRERVAAIAGATDAAKRGLGLTQSYLPGELCLETTDLLTPNSLGSLQAANPEPGFAAFVFSEDREHAHPQRSGQKKEVKHDHQ